MMRARLIVYASEHADWIEEVMRRSLDGTWLCPSGRITACEVNVNNLTIEQSRAVSAATNKKGEWPANALAMQENK